MSKNYGLKIAVRVYVRIYARAYDCGQIVFRTHDQDQDQDQDTAGTQDTTGTHHQKKGGLGQTKICYCLEIYTPNNEKKYKKS